MKSFNVVTIRSLLFLIFIYLNNPADSFARLGSLNQKHIP